MTRADLSGGFSRIANTLLEAIVALKIPGQPLRVWLYVAREAYGRRGGRKTIRTNARAIELATGLPRRSVRRLLFQLVEAELVTIEGLGQGRRSFEIGIQTDPALWSWPDPEPEKAQGRAKSHGALMPRRRRRDAPSRAQERAKSKAQGRAKSPPQASLGATDTAAEESGRRIQKKKTEEGTGAGSPLSKRNGEQRSRFDGDAPLGTTVDQLTIICSHLFPDRTRDGVVAMLDRQASVLKNRAVSFLSDSRGPISVAEQIRGFEDEALGDLRSVVNRLIAGGIKIESPMGLAIPVLCESAGRARARAEGG